MLKMMVYRAWVQEHMPLNSHWLADMVCLRREALISMIVSFVDSM